MNWSAAKNTAAYTPNAEHPNSVNQDYYVSWNNAQANGLRGRRLRAESPCTASTCSTRASRR